MKQPTLTALISVSDKSGIVDFASALAQRGVRLLSTGGTAKLLLAAGLDVTEVADHTGSPEILDGRVKTLHPRIHAGLLARRDKASHLNTLKEHQIPTIDLLVVNLYPFQSTIDKASSTFEEAIENIDIGGPAMIRAAAKNFGDAHGGVTVVIDPADYERVLNEIDGPGAFPSYQLRLQLATKAFSHTAAYDAAITGYLSSLSQTEPAPDTPPARNNWPETLFIQASRGQELRYGENPHQSAAFYTDPTIPSGTLAGLKQKQGKALSYNNLADADAAWECVRHLPSTACVIVKHANPCGAALGETPLEAYQKAFQTDPTSAFGGIIAFNRTVDRETAHAILEQQFVEVMIAPSYEAEALEVLASKPNVRVLQIPHGSENHRFDVKRIGGGWLIQSPDWPTLEQDGLTVVTEVRPSNQTLQDLLFAWKIAKYVKSNAIVFAANGQTLGIGAGQMSRVDSARIAAIKAENAGLSLEGSAVASDAFFPFRDGLDVVAQAGARSVIQPGGSIRDDEVIAAANEQNVAMVFTGLRHFRH
ncbi:MAG TPA: bifunctional phosphoribosylaminoimidazolecarboxamide formyltransferase/IMP cyclohydrolase [Burkholderiaceae bacterium]|nr:bifunctional phosphoribosylaminoimidazolecarboxamide formyltransferase/IMP cyclohydrolase [Burkholderiaceae bacterium]